MTAALAAGGRRDDHRRLSLSDPHPVGVARVNERAVRAWDTVLPIDVGRGFGEATRRLVVTTVGSRRFCARSSHGSRLLMGFVAPFHRR